MSKGENDSPKIYRVICEAMKDIKAIGKDKKNQDQGFKFRGIDDVYNAVQPIFAKHGLFTVPEILEQTREERRSRSGGVLMYSICKIRYSFYADDGSHVDAVVIGEGMDSGDKATNKAMSIAMKYALFQVFAIPTEDTADPDAESPEVAPRGASAPARASAPASGKMINMTAIKKELADINDPDAVRGWYGHYVQKHNLTEKQKGLLQAICSERVASIVNADVSDEDLANAEIPEEFIE